MYSAPENSLFSAVFRATLQRFSAKTDALWIFAGWCNKGRKKPG